MPGLSDMLDEEFTISVEGAPEVIFDDDEIAISQESEEISIGEVDDFYDNLVEQLDTTYLTELATDIIEKVDSDNEGRKPWLDRYKRGIEALGIVESSADDDAIFEGASQVKYPLLMNSIIQTQARLLGEIYPAGGAVKSETLGQSTPELEEKGLRAENYLNYQMQYEDKGYFEEVDQMLFHLGIAGSVFTKTYYDQLKNTIITKFIKPEDFIVPYHATSLESAERYTHKIGMSQNEMKKLQAIGFYAKEDLEEPTADDEGNVLIVDKIDGKVDQSVEGDDEHIVYETYLNLDIPEFEDVDNGGEPTGIALPYVVSVEVNSEKVIAVRRNWEKPKDGDEIEEYVEKETKHCFVHQKYMPGLGFYGLGLYHLIGGLTDAATGAMRALLDAGAISTLQGGFKKKGVGTSGDITLRPLEYQEIDVLDGQKLSDSFYTPPFGESSATLFNLLGLLIEAGEKTSSTTEALIGAGGANTPVGTELARIEQGSKVYTAIHKRVHAAAAREFVIRAELNHEWLSDEAYPYFVKGEDREIRSSDFDERVDIIPVSDPNIASASLRIAQAQSVYQMYMANPEGWSSYAVITRLLRAQGIENVDELYPNKDELPLLDAISEVQALLMQKDVRAHPEQDHTAHIQVISAFMQHPDFGGDPAIKEMIMPRVLALLAEHKAYEFGQVLGQNGAQPALVNLSSRTNSILEQDMDIDTETAITQSAAQALEGFMQSKGARISPEQQQQQGEADAAQAKVQAEIEANKAKINAELEAFSAKTQSSIEGKQAETQSDIERKNAASKAEQERRDYELERAENRKDVEAANNSKRVE